VLNRALDLCGRTGRENHCCITMTIQHRAHTPTCALHFTPLHGSLSRLPQDSVEDASLACHATSGQIVGILALRDRTEAKTSICDPAPCQTKGAKPAATL